MAVHMVTIETMASRTLQPPPGARCELEGCGKPLQGGYVRDTRGHFFCAAHQAELRPCRFCGRAFVPGNGANSGACALCTRRGVTSPKEAEARYRRVATWFEQQGLHLAAPLPGIGLQASLSKANMLGFTEKIEEGGGWLGARSIKTPRIVLRIGLPPEIFDIVTSHELGHVWLTAQNIQLSELMEEGICTWLSYRFTLNRSTEDNAWLASQIAEQTDPIYGAGFRRFSKLAGNASPADLPRILHSNRAALIS
jgi:hypothetical protein